MNATNANLNRARFLRHIWDCSWDSAAEVVLNGRMGETWYRKPTTLRLRAHTAALIRERWFGRVIIATSIISSAWAAIAVVVVVAVFKALT